MQVEDDIPVPGPRKEPSKFHGLTNILFTMEVGQSVLTPATTNSQVSGYIGRSPANRKFTTRKEPGGVRIWRIA